MSFTYTYRLPIVFRTVGLIVLLSLPALVQAETKTIESEATYSMGDGETPSFAEAMVLQKAKQMALEEAGTYVESYTKVRNLDLTAEEIETIAGGVVQVEVLEKKRSSVGESFQFFIKIKATVTTDRMEELAQRVRGRNVAEEYKRLQDNYTRLSKEFEVLKLSLAKSPAGPGRDAALAQIRERESEFRSLQQSEATFFKRLISGETLFLNALAQISQKENEKKAVENLFEKIVMEGHLISLGEPTIHARLDNKSTVGMRVLVTIRATHKIWSATQDLVRSLGGPLLPASYKVDGDKGRFDIPIFGLSFRISNDPDTVAYFQNRIANLVFVMEAHLKDNSSIGCYVAPHYQDIMPSGSAINVDWLGIAPIAFGNSTSGTMHIYGLGPSPFGTSSVLDMKEGFVVIPKEPITFTIETTLSLEAARQMSSLTGKIVEGKRRGQEVQGKRSYYHKLLEVPDLEKCSIVK